MGFCIEFESVIYICDVQINFIKICIKVYNCVYFFKVVGCLYEVFLVYNKGVYYIVKSVEEVIYFVGNVEKCLTK